MSLRSAPFGERRTRGASRLAVVLAVLALAVVGGAAFMVLRANSSRPGVPEPVGVVKPLDNAASVALVRQSGSKLGTYRTVLELYLEDNGGWRRVSELIERRDVRNLGEDNAFDVSSTVEKIRVFAPDGSETPAQQSPAWQGKTFHVAYDTSGRMTTLGAPPNFQVNGELMVQLLAVTLSDPNRLVPTGTLKPGDKWEQRVAGALPGQSGSEYEWVQRVEYQGLVEKDGRRMVQCGVQFDSMVRNVVTGEEKNPKYTQRGILLERLGTGSGSMWIDPETSRVTEMFVEARLDNTVRGETIMAGATEPVVTPEQSFSLSLRNRFVLEYDS